MSVSAPDEAILAIKNRITNISRADTPLDWASLHLRLGDALMASSEPAATERAREAWQAYSATMETCTPDQDVEIWAKSAAGLANAWVVIGSAPNGPSAVLGKATLVLQDVLRKYPRVKDPATWATMQIRLAQVFMVRARQCNDAPSARRARTQLAEALVALYTAAEIFNEVMYPDRWKKLKAMIGDAHSHLDRLNGEIRHICCHLTQAGADRPSAPRNMNGQCGPAAQQDVCAGHGT